MTNAPSASEKPQYTENTAMPKHIPIDTTRSVSLLRKRRQRLSTEGITYTPTKNHIIRKNDSLATLISSSEPSTELLSAIDDSITIINTANRSSTISTANTNAANFCWRRPISVNALMMMVVDDIESIPPKNRQLMKLKPKKCPTIKPANIIPATIISAVTTAAVPERNNFLKLNSRPKEKSNTTIPN